VSNDNIDERIFKLWSMICKMIIDKVRDPGMVADVLQNIVGKPVRSINVYGRLRELWAMIYKMIEDKTLDPKKVVDVLQSIVNKPVVKTYLRRLCVVKLGTTGSTCNYEIAAKIFKAGFDPDFENWEIFFSGVAPETNIAIDELVEDGKFPDFLGNTAEELEKRRLLGAQWLKFCKDKSDKLCKDGCVTFAVLTKDDKPVAQDLSNTFVACVKVEGEHGWMAHGYVYRFSYDDPWRTGGDHWHHQVIYPISI